MAIMAVFQLLVFAASLAVSYSQDKSACQKDVLIVYDVSHSIGTTKEDFSRKVLPFLNAFLENKSLNVRRTGTHLALMTFSHKDKITSVFKFHEVKQKVAKLKKYFTPEGIDYGKVTGGSKDVGAGLQKAKEIYFPKASPQNARKQSSDVLLLVTDGKNGKKASQATLDQAAQTLKNRGIVIVGALVGDHRIKFKKNVESIASSSGHVFDVGGDNVDASAVDKLVQKLCVGTSPLTPPVHPGPGEPPVRPTVRPPTGQPPPGEPKVSKMKKPDTPLPTLSEFQKTSSDSKDRSGSYKINDVCSVTAAKVDSVYQMKADAPAVDCVNLAALLKLVLPKDKANFEPDSAGFVITQNIIIRSLSLNTATKGVDISAGYNGTVPLIPGTITLSNVRMQISFVHTRSRKFTFDMAASLSIGSVSVDVKIVRNEEGYYLTASTDTQITATDISRFFKIGDSFLPSSTCLRVRLENANFHSFAIQKLRMRAAFTEGYGFLFGGQMRLFDWGPVDVNILINKPNDSPTSVTIAVYTPSFSIPQMFKDLFGMNISRVPVLGKADLRNMALTISTHDVPTPLTVFDIGSQDLFPPPYPKGLKVIFEVSIAGVYVTTSILISTTKLSISVTQPGDLTLRKVVESFLADDSSMTTGDGKNKKLAKWPSIIADPLEISFTVFGLEATQVSNKWGMSYLNTHLKMKDTIELFNKVIRITDLSFDMTWRKNVGEAESKKSGLIAASVSIGSGRDESPKVDIKIPFPFENEEIAFTFTDFSFQKVAKALGFEAKVPNDFTNFLAQIQLDLIALAFNDAGKFDKITVRASIPQKWHIFGLFSIENVKLEFVYDGIAGAKSSREWKLSVNGNIIISSCTISVEAGFGNKYVSIDAAGRSCSASIADLLSKVNINPSSLPSQISGFSMGDPVVWFKWDRKMKAKSIGFAATTSLFGSSVAEVGLINANGKTGVVAAFTVQSASQLSEINFLSSLGLADVAVVYISEKMVLTPFDWRKPIFKEYARADRESPSGLTINAKFVPSESNLLGRLLKKAGSVEVKVSLTVPDLYFEAVISNGDKDVALEGAKNGKFFYMKLIISKRLIGLEVKFRLEIHGKTMDFTGEVTFTFGATVTISLLWEGEWDKPLGLNNFKIYRLGLALGINVASLLPSFGITGALKVSPPYKSKKVEIIANVTLCVDTANPLTTVVEIHFTRLLLSDVVNTFANKDLGLPKDIAEMGFPDEVNIFVSPEGNDACFGKRYEAGVEIHGTFQIPFLKIRAKIDLKLKLKPKFLLNADLQMDPINYGNGLLRLVSAQSNDIGPYLSMNIGESLKEFRISGSCRIVLFGASVSVQVIINSEQLFFEARLKLWSIFEARLLVDLSLKEKQLHVLGEMQNDLFAKLKQRAAQGIQAGARVVNEKIEGAQRKVRNAEDEVRKIQGSIDYHQRKISEAKHECSSAPWYKKYKCIATGAKVVYHGGIIATLWVAKNAALGVLKVADLFLEGVKKAIKIGASVLQTLVTAALSVIDIKYVKFEARLTTQTQSFNFKASIVILGWKFEPSFTIDFSSQQKADDSINKVGDSVAKDTVKKIE